MLPCTNSLLCFYKGDLVDGVKCHLATRGKHTNLLWAIRSTNRKFPLKLPAMNCVFCWSFPSEYWQHYNEESAKGMYWLKYLVKIISFILNNLGPISCCSKFIFGVNKYHRVTKDVPLWCKYSFRHWLQKPRLFRCWCTTLICCPLSE